MTTIDRAIAQASHDRNDGAGYSLRVHMIGGAIIYIDVYPEYYPHGHLLRIRGGADDRCDITLNDAHVMFCVVEY